ncbi:putative retrotransposon hot spot protein 4 (RHS4) [Trypanosoma vivax]|nr:putative retrotransposon hot spot protein 4 (RHS4) [Trypanosoma vivax]
MSESEAAVVITGAFESVVNARWSYVESGHVDMPLGLKIFDGTVDGVVVPPVWSFAEVKEISGVDELEVLDLESDGECDMAAEHERDRVAAGQHCVEVFVLTSAMGWPYTRFEAANARCVFVRREMVRVWRVVEEQIQMWPNCTHQCLNKPYILLGTRDRQVVWLRVVPAARAAALRRGEGACCRVFCGWLRVHLPQDRRHGWASCVL